MDGKKFKYLFSPALTSHEPIEINVKVSSEEEEYKDNGEDIYEDDSDLLSHSDMTWGSLEEGHVIHDILSDDLASSSSTSSDTSSMSEQVSISTERNKYCIEQNSWGSYGLNVNLWDDEKAPVVKVRRLKEVLLNDLEFCGILTDRLIGVGSSFLAKSPENNLYVLNKFVLRNMALGDITLLYYHRYLRYIDVAYNNISNLSPLSGIPYLTYLNVAHNRINKGLNFTPPWYLTYVNLSYNYLSEISDFTNFWSIVHLDLSHNAIEVISGLQNLKYLKYLNLSYNLIDHIENLDKLNIQELNLEGNCIVSFKSGVPQYGISTLPRLHTIMLGYNRLSTLEFFKNAYSLRTIDLKFNKINDLLEVSNFSGSIHEIDLRGNGCTKWPNYKGVLLFSIPSIKIIDGAEVTVCEKVSATTLFASPLNLVAARTVTKLILLEQLSVPKIDLHVTPYDKVCPPLIILSGPSALKKTALALHVARTFPNKVKYCQWYTTKEIEENDAESESYIFVHREEFNDMTRRGDFLAIQEILGDSYGFHHSQIISLILEKKIGITQMDLHATIQMRKRYSNIKPILVLTKSEEIHRSWIQEKFDVYTWIKDSVESLLAVRIGKHADKDTTDPPKPKVNFIEDIIVDIVDDLELPSYTTSIRSQRTQASRTDIKFESKVTLPKIVITRSETETEDKTPTMLKEEERKHSLPENFHLFDEEYHLKGLRVILDEHANIIVEDETTKRKRQQARILYRRSTETHEPDFFIEELDESVSSEEILIQPHSKILTERKDPERLKHMFTELVIKSRKMYMDHHMQEPGFFSLVLLMDDYSKAYNMLITFICETYVNYPSQKPKFLSEMDYLEQTAVPGMLDAIVEEMKEALSSSTLQRKALLRTYGVNSCRVTVPDQEGDLNRAD